MRRLPNSFLVQEWSETDVSTGSSHFLRKQERVDNHLLNDVLSCLAFLKINASSNSTSDLNFPTLWSENYQRQSISE